MKYNGIELTEMLPENWDGKTREMLVWCAGSPEPSLLTVIGYDSMGWIDCETLTHWTHCAEIQNESSADELKAQIKRLKEENKNLCDLFNDKSNEYEKLLEENKSLKEENENLKTEVNELKNSCSYQVYSDMLNEKAELEDQIANLQAENNDLKSRIKSLLVARGKMANTVSGSVWKELMDRANQYNGAIRLPAGLGFNDISDIVLNKIIDYKPEKKVRRMTYKELDEWLEQDKGVIRMANSRISNKISYDCEDRNREVNDAYKICGWNEDTWREPLIEE